MRYSCTGNDGNNLLINCKNVVEFCNSMQFLTTRIPVQLNLFRHVSRCFLDRDQIWSFLTHCPWFSRLTWALFVHKAACTRWKMCDTTLGYTANKASGWLPRWRYNWRSTRVWNTPTFLLAFTVKWSQPRKPKLSGEFFKSNLEAIALIHSYSPYNRIRFNSSWQRYIVYFVRDEITKVFVRIEDISEDKTRHISE